jgi:hypothetical protein
MPEFNGTGGGSFPGFLGGGNSLTPPEDIPPEAVEVFEHWLNILENDEELDQGLDQALEDGIVTFEEDYALFDRAFNLIMDDMMNNNDCFQNLIERYYIDGGFQCSMLAGHNALVM